MTVNVHVPRGTDVIERRLGHIRDDVGHFALATGRMFLSDARVKPRSLQDKFPSLDISEASGTTIDFQV